ncbi:ribonuclease III, partial [Candidatus Gastranaerophilus sp. (ex Termes propinquus)]
EAFLGALFLEFGLEYSKKFLLENFSDEIEEIGVSIESSNPKALLQEYTQGKTCTLPIYKVLSEKGEAHKKTFEVGVYYNDELLALGTGLSKKDAQQEAARNALLGLNILKGEE